jgi:hypothetical protein
VPGVPKSVPDGEVPDRGDRLFDEVHVCDPGEPPGLAQSLTRQCVCRRVLRKAHRPADGKARERLTEGRVDPRQQLAGEKA